MHVRYVCPISMQTLKVDEQSEVGSLQHARFDKAVFEYVGQVFSFGTAWT